MKARQTRQPRAHLLAQVKVGSWWRCRFTECQHVRKGGPFQIAAIDASNPLDVRVSWTSGGKTVSAVNLVGQYDPCDPPAPKVAPKPEAKHSPLNGAGEAIREIVRDEIRVVLAELRPIVREEARAALADAFGESAA